VQVAATDWDAANAIASSVMARRGENHLHRRYMRMRQRLYRRRFARATPPWLPSLTGKTIVSSAEVAFLFELPSARMKSVPVRRITRPRIPRPPEAAKPRERVELPPLAVDGTDPLPADAAIANPGLGAVGAANDRARRRDGRAEGA